jgi:peroxiredoxin
MWQAEIAGQRTAPPQEAPAKGALIRDFQLTSSEGKSILLSEYRGRFNMVLVLAGESEGVVGFLAGLQEHQAELAANEARVLVILAGSQQHASDLKQSLHLNFEVLADKDGHVHRLFGAKDRAGHICPAVFITDRFGEVFAAYSVAHDKLLPGLDEILSWIDLINRECPECAPPEWPD